MIGTFTQTFSNRWKSIATALALALLALALFYPATGYDFIILDDNRYVADNPRVITGLSWRNVVWAFTTVHENWWLPLLWISYMVDVELFGADAFGFHLTNVLLHALNVALLFWFLYRLTGSIWRSAVVAALFAVHPLRVESVVWIAARKDVLSGLFFMLGLLAYLRYTERPSPRRMGLVALLMLAGLLAKAIVIVLPAVLLLLDYWPLRRARALWGVDFWKEWRPLFREKTALLILIGLFAVINLTTHESGRGAFAQVTMLERVSFIFPNYWAYLGQWIRPIDLVLVYPERDVVNWPLSLAALAGLLAVTGVFLRVRSRCPYLIVGWAWFLVALFPVIRGVRWGLAAYADRFTYLPSIGLFLLVVWAAAEWLPARPWRKPVLSVAALSLIAACCAGARAYLPHWKNSESIFLRTMALTEDNYIIYINMAAVYNQQGRLDQEVGILHEALRVRPWCPTSHVGIGVVLRNREQIQEATRHFLIARQYAGPHEWEVFLKTGEHFALIGQYDEAINNFQMVLRRQPDHAPTHHNLGMCHQLSGRHLEALSYFQSALRLDPTYERSYFGMGNALLALERPDEAAEVFQHLMAMTPDKIEYQNAYAAALSKSGRNEEAVALYQELLNETPDVPELLNNLAWLLAAYPSDSVHDPRQAIAYALRATELSKREHPAMLGTLAMAYAANQQFDKAAAIAEEALALADRLQMHDLRKQLNTRIARYRSGTQ